MVTRFVAGSLRVDIDKPEASDENFSARRASSMLTSYSRSRSKRCSALSLESRLFGRSIMPSVPKRMSLAWSLATAAGSWCSDGTRILRVVG